MIASVNQREFFTKPERVSAVRTVRRRGHLAECSVIPALRFGLRLMNRDDLRFEVVREQNL